MATYGSGKIVCNYVELASRIIDEKYVVVDATIDPESLEIIDCLKACSLDRYYSLHLEKIPTFEALEFLYHLEDTETIELKSSVEGKESMFHLMI